MTQRSVALYVLLLLGLPAPLAAQAWSGLLAPERAIDWSVAGIPGGIPSATWANCTTTACTTAFATPTAANINAALATAPNNTVVRIPAGTFSLSTSIHANRSNVVLRGAGPTQTLITVNGNNILMGNGSAGQGSWPSTPVQTTWTGGLTRGSTVLTVGSTTNLRAGQAVVIDERNPAWVFTDGIEGPCTSGNSCGRDDSPVAFGGDAVRAQPQMTKIVSVDSATQITVRDPVGYTHTAALSPQVFSWSDSGVYGNKEYLGIENLKVNAGGQSFALSFPYCDYCWAQNVEVDDAGRAAIWIWYSYGGIYRNNYIGHAPVAGGPTQYGFDPNNSSMVLIENNILYNVTSPIVPETVYGVVFAYNYMQNSVTDNLFASFTGHLSHSSFNLVEGNVANRFAWDNAWGSSSHNTLFRNRADGTGLNKTNYRFPLGLYAHQRYQNVIGNVLGTPFHTIYNCDDTNDLGSNEGFIYDLGGWNACGQASPRDAVTRTSLVRWGNWDSVTWAANGSTNGIRFCTGSAAGNPACTASETASTDPTFPGLTTPTTTLPASLYLATRPAWWGSVPWPPIGPDVTGGTITNTAGHAYKIPAQNCYEATAKTSGGALTGFDAAVCYPTSGPAGSVPAAPTNVRVVP